MSWSDLAKKLQPSQKQDSSLSKSYGSFEYYAFIFGYLGKIEHNFTNFDNYHPKALAVDSEGNYIPSKYPKKTNKTTPWQETELEITGDGSVDDTAVHRWNTPASVLSNLPEKHKRTCNAIKTWLSKYECALWWHDGNCDMLSKFGGPHLHVIATSVSVGNGMYQRINTGTPYKSVVESIKDAGGYAKSQGVKSLESFILYLNCPPRVFMGSCNVKIGAIRAEFNRRGTEWSAEANTLLDEWLDGCESDDIEPSTSQPARQRRNAFECNEEVAEMVTRVQNRKRNAGYDAGSNAGEPTEDVQPEPPKRTKFDPEQGECAGMGPMEVPKQTARTKFVSNLEKVMIKYNRHDKEALCSLQSKIGSNHKVSKFIEHLTRMGTLEQFTQSAKDNLKIKYQERSFLDIAKEARYSNWFDPKDHYTIEKSLEWFIGWVEGQNWPISKLIKNISDVYDKNKTKINSLVVFGESNTGKSLFLLEPLQKLHPSYALYTSAANEDRFAFGEFPGKRVAFSHECEFGTQQLDMAKQIMGGQDTDVDVKHKNRVRVYRLPFFITSNKMPWGLCRSDADKTAFKNRCYFYETRQDPEVPELDKQLHPGMWYYLLLGLDSDFEDPDYSTGRLLMLGSGESPVAEPVDEESDYELE